MSGYRIDLVTLQNFGPFEEAEYSLSSPGLTMVEGEIHGRDGLESNGSGKSFLFDAVSFALFGRCIRPQYQGDDVVRLGSKGGAMVCVVLKSEDHTMTVTRYRKHRVHGNDLRFVLDGKDLTGGTDTITKALVESALGLDFTTFCNSVAFGARQDVKSFFFAGDTERKEILERLLGLERYARALKVVSVRMVAAQAEVTRCSTAKTKADSRLDALQEEKGRVEDALDVEELEIQEAVRWVRVFLLQAQRDKFQRRFDVVDEMMDGEAADIVRAARGRAEAVVAEWWSLVEKKEEEFQAKDIEAAKSRSRWEALEEEIDAVEALDGQVCPTCKQEVNDTDDLTAEMRERFDALEKETYALEQAAQDLHDEIEEMRENPPCVHVPEDTLWANLQWLRAHYESERARLDAKARAEEGVRAVVAKALTAAASRKTDLEKREAEILKAVEDADAALEEAQDAMERLEFWKTGFGNGGVKSFLIEAEIPRINRKATEYAQRLLGVGAMIQLSATTQLKTRNVARERMSIAVTVPGLTESYAGASTGMKKRVDLALLLAFRDVVAHRVAASLSLFMADEIFDGLDGAGMAFVGGLLKEASAEGPVAVITHDPRLKFLADTTLTVYHDGESKACLGGKPVFDAPVKKTVRA